MEAFLRALLPRLLPPDRSFDVHPFQGKPDLLGKLASRLRGYAAWLPEDSRIVVVVDRDDDDCAALKARLEEIAADALLSTRSHTAGRDWQVVNRIAIEELEAWYFGDWEAVRTVYPRVPSTVPRRAAYRNPDAVTGGTWEAFERVLMHNGYYRGGLAKVEAARLLGAHVSPARSTSASFGVFCNWLDEAFA